jgi:hypothetical protein
MSSGPYPLGVAALGAAPGRDAFIALFAVIADASVRTRAKQRACPFAGVSHAFCVWIFPAAAEGAAACAVTVPRPAAASAIAPVAASRSRRAT